LAKAGKIRLGRPRLFEQPDIPRGKESLETKKIKSKESQKQRKSKAKKVKNKENQKQRKSKTKKIKSKESLYCPSRRPFE
jgi:hypothetical protein